MKVSIVISVYNEAKSLELFFKELIFHTQNLGYDFEYLFIDDGSTDPSLKVIQKLKSQNTHCHVKVVKLSRNFGHEAAMIAGIDHATGDCVICLDSDLQHPPELIKEMVKAFEKGAEVVLMARKTRIDRNIFFSLPSKIFYNLINLISKTKFVPQASDFFLISKRVAHLLKTDFRERTRFIRGIIQFMGFDQQIIRYTAKSRVAGESKYNILKLTLLSFSAIASFSQVPLKIGLLAGTLTGLFSLVVLFYTIIMWFKGFPPAGYTTTVILISFLFSVLFLLLGIVGEYIGYIFNETKSRPIYIVDTIDE